MALNAARDGFAEAVGALLHCAAFTANLDWLPQDLVVGADHHLILSPLTGADVTTVARQISSRPPKRSFPDEKAALLTPRLLRLARRPGQTGNAYLRKLGELLEREQAPAQPASAGSKSVRSAPRLERLHGMEAAVQWGFRLADDLVGYGKGSVAWADVDCGLLLSGPPGCGKTLFARALAETCGLPLVSGSYQEWHGTGRAHQGDLLKAMKQTFETARESAPCILFIDEVDSFPNRATLRHDYADWDIQVVNALLAEMDGVAGREGVVAVAACNHPHLLDPALTRSGRLDRHIRIELPDTSALTGIIKEHIGDEMSGVDLTPAALVATGATGADVERFARGARRRARNAGRPMRLEDLLAEMNDGDCRSPGDLWLAATHEAGHAVAFLELGLGMLNAVSLRAAGTDGGLTAAIATAMATATTIHRRLVVHLAGRAAEQVFFGEPTDGAGGDWDSDLAAATTLATTAASALGLDPEIGLTWLGRPTPATLTGMLERSPRLAECVRMAVDKAYADAVLLIRKKHSCVRALATALMERGALDGKEVAELVARQSDLDGEKAPRRTASSRGGRGRPE